MRRDELATLDYLEVQVLKRLRDEEYAKAQLFAVDRLLTIMERRAKLMGLDTPVDQAQYMNMVVVQEAPQGYLTGGTQQ